MIHLVVPPRSRMTRCGLPVTSVSTTSLKDVTNCLDCLKTVVVQPESAGELVQADSRLLGMSEMREPMLPARSDIQRGNASAGFQMQQVRSPRGRQDR